ncbi:MAG: FtsH protease activity modulator HflK [Sphaerochaetaceae bacterium]|nr:FtsH protease activity modulator HflK [Sphaerochaetaceae bacterium]MDC7236397.1 FtsH protease activity modulator HflK [Sphaerochaetaceae bacterium]MDC7251083.1 FtsH protease activity modulator HflK [Sphaerochaetaceae bacterium]
MDQEPFKTAKKNLNISPKLIIGLIIAVIVLASAMSSFFVVDQTEQAVVTRFGKYNRTVGPGLQTKIPLGVEKSYKVPTQVVQTMTFGYRSSITSSPLISSTDFPSESIMLTGDLNIIDLEWIVQYQISNPEQWLFNVQQKETTIRDISQSVMNQLVGDLPILSVMTSERTSIEVQAQVEMQNKFDDYGLGIRVVTVKLQNIVPPEGDVQNAFEDVNKAIQDMNRFINEGKEQYNSVIPKAQGEAKQQIQIAEGYAKERVNNAKGDVARFNSMRDTYEQSKQITADRLYLETMEEIFLENSNNITLIDKDLKNFLPISQIDSSNKTVVVESNTTTGGSN